MSLGDELRYLRARAGGPTPFEIAEATGIDAGLYRQLEQRYREIGDDETVEKLAAYFGCDAGALKRARARSRKALSQHIASALQRTDPIQLELRTGETLSGRVVWWDLGTIGLDPEDSGTVIVVQRHAVTDWQSQAP
jgi:transcriptional regulator with XRE-family HTH domain